MGRLWYLNGDFDLELAGEPIGRLERAVAEMSLWFLLAAEADDRVICDRTPPPEYLEHLVDAGLVVAKPAEEGQRYPEHSAEAWGWTERSRDRLAGFGARLSHPPLEVVARANGRLFAHRVTQELGLGVPGATQVEPGRLLRGESPLSGPQVVKPLHSAAGRGMLRSLDGSWNPQQQAVLEVLEDQGAPIVLEPWLERTTDLASRFDLDENGRLSKLRHHRCLVGTDGTFYANLMRPEETQEGYADILAQAAERIGQALSQEGYFGPVGLDAFLYRDKGGEQGLAAAVDINARHPVCSLAYALWQRIGLEQCFLLRTLTVKKHHLPNDYQAWSELLGATAYEKSSRNGALLLTPLRLPHPQGSIQPKRSLLAIVAPTMTDLENLYRDAFPRLGKRVNPRLPWTPAP
jgi:hypothetical protein